LDVLQIAWQSPCDLKTLIRAAGENVGEVPSIAKEVALAVLNWICQGKRRSTLRLT
jgi:hypothetical protein